MEAKQTVTPVCYGVSTTESSKDGFHVEITDARLNIGLVYPHGFDPRRRKCNVDELWEAARKLNAHDDLVKALKVARDCIALLAAAPSTFEIIDAAIAKAGAQ